jgi:Icc protein
MADSVAAHQPDTGTWMTTPGTLRVLHLTDLHLGAGADWTLLGQVTRKTLARVLSRARARHWPPDALLLTGDLVHDESIEGYRYLREVIDDLGVPCYCIPGNHDRAELLAAEVDPRADLGCRIERLGGWDLLLLDSTVEGSDGGALAAETLTTLAEALAADRQRPAMICVHHQPVPVGSRWLDTMTISNGEALIEIVDAHSRVRAVLWGHVHQTFDRTQGGTRLLATPSTCAQFEPGRVDFGLDDNPPGYRWLELASDGSLRTGVEWVPLD